MTTKSGDRLGKLQLAANVSSNNIIESDGMKEKSSTCATRLSVRSLLCAKVIAQELKTAGRSPSGSAISRLTDTFVFAKKKELLDSMHPGS